MQKPGALSHIISRKFQLYYCMAQPVERENSALLYTYGGEQKHKKTQEEA